MLPLNSAGRRERRSSVNSSSSAFEASAKICGIFRKSFFMNMASHQMWRSVFTGRILGFRFSCVSCCCFIATSLPLATTPQVPLTMIPPVVNFLDGALQSGNVSDKLYSELNTSNVVVWDYFSAQENWPFDFIDVTKSLSERGSSGKALPYLEICQIHWCCKYEIIW